MIPLWGTDQPLVSCLMVTQAKRWEVGLPPGARCYLDQVYFRRELVIVTKDPHPAMLDFVGTFPGAGVRFFDVSDDAPATLGELRNISVEMSAGEFVATWDDDDVSAPERLVEQVRLLAALPLCDAALLARMRVADDARGRRFISAPFAWEPTMVARRSSMTRYPEFDAGEDEAVIACFRRVVLLDRPDLYTYRVHGSNVSAGQRAEAFFAQRSGGAW